MAREITVKIDTANKSITWTAGTASVVLDVSKVSADNQAYAVYHGLKQKAGDAAALDKGATVEQKFAEIRKNVDYLMSGDVPWNRKAVGGGAPAFDPGAVVTALAQVKFSGDVDKTNRAVEAVAARDNRSRDDTLKMFAQDADVAAQMARNKARAKAATVPSADDMLKDIPTGDEGAAG